MNNQPLFPWEINVISWVLQTHQSIQSTTKVKDVLFFQDKRCYNVVSLKEAVNIFQDL